jgi:hypothetical protein
MDKFIDIGKVLFGFVLVFLPVWIVLAYDWFASFWNKGGRGE